MQPYTIIKEKVQHTQKKRKDTVIDLAGVFTLC